MSQSAPRALPRPPTEDDLPYSGGENMESEIHFEQVPLLVRPLYRIHWAERDDVYVGGDMFFYFSFTQTKRNDFRGPDCFVVLDTVRRLRKSWVTWAEGGRLPEVIVEVASPSTKHVDLGEKKDVYALLGIPYYVVFDPDTAELWAWRFDEDRGGYVALDTSSGRVALPGLALDLAVWRGAYGGLEADWLRWHLPGGPPIPTHEDLADAARSVAETLQAEADAASAEAEAAKAETNAAKAEAEAAKADAEAAKAVAEAAKAELAALKAKLSE